MTLPISLLAVDAAVRNRLFQQYVEPRLAAIRRSVEIMTFAGEDADDNLQEVLLHLLDVIPQYDPTQTAPSTWIGRVVTNFMNDLHDRQAVRRRRNPDVSSYDDPSTSLGQAHALCYDDDALRYVDDDDDPSPGSGQALDDSVVPVEAGVCPADYPTTYGALMLLTPRRRGVLLRHAAGHSVPEIAAALGCSTSVVSATLSRAKAQMRDSLSTLSKNSVYDSFQELRTL